MQERRGGSNLRPCCGDHLPLFCCLWISSYHYSCGIWLPRCSVRREATKPKSKFAEVKGCSYFPSYSCSAAELNVDSWAGIAYAPASEPSSKALSSCEYIHRPIISLNQSLLPVTAVLAIRIGDGLERGAKYTN